MSQKHTNSTPNPIGRIGDLILLEKTRIRPIKIAMIEMQRRAKISIKLTISPFTMFSTIPRLEPIYIRRSVTLLPRFEENTISSFFPAS